MRNIKVWLFLIFSSSLSNSSADDNIPEIEVKVFRDTNGDLQCDGKSPVLLLNAQFQVHVKYTNTLYHLRFYNINEINAIEVTDFWAAKNKHGFVSKTHNMTQPGNKYYTCEFYTNSCDIVREQKKCYYYKDNSRTTYYEAKAIRCHIAVNVLEPDEYYSTLPLTGYLTANTENFTTIANVPVSERTYYFYDGEPTTFTCHGSTGDFIELTYYDKARKSISTEVQSANSVYMYIKLTRDNDGTYIDCTMTAKVYERKTILRVHLIKNRMDKQAIGFEVNGLILPRNNVEGNQEYYYQYEYYHAEPLTIIIVKDDQLYGDITCNAEGANLNYNWEQKFNVQRDLFTNPFITTLYDGQTKTSLQCTVTYIIDQAQSVHIQIAFILQTPTYRPYIRELSMANVMLMYKNATSNIIYYSYTKNDGIHLTCEGAVPQQQIVWKYGPGEISSENSSKIVIPPHLNTINLVTCEEAPSPPGRRTHLELIPTEMETAPVTSPPRPVSTDWLMHPASQPGRHHKIPTAAQPRPALEAPSGNQLTPNREPPQRHPKLEETWQQTTTNRPRVENWKPVYFPKPEASTSNPAAARPGNTKLNVVISCNGAWRVGDRYKDTSDVLVYNLTVGQVNSGATPGLGQGSPAEDLRPSTTESPKNFDTSVVNKNQAVWYVAVGVVLLGIAVAVLWAVMKLIKRTRSNQNSRPDALAYVNLPHRNEGPMEIPSQWNTPADSNTCAMPQKRNIEELYSKPVPKSLRGKEPTYSQAFDSILDEPTYASVHQEPTYAEVGRYQNFKGIQTDGMTYANLDLGSNSGRVLTPQSSNYVQIEHKASENYANVGDLKQKLGDSSVGMYSNVLTDTNESTEPAYCEVGALK